MDQDQAHVIPLRPIPKSADRHSSTLAGVSRVAKANYFWLACSTLLLACSIVPPASKPPSREVEIEAVYEWTARSEPRPAIPEIAVPSSSANLTVLELATEPAWSSERFIDRQRHLTVPGPLRRVVLRCRYRLFGSDDLRAEGEPFADAPSPLDLFPGAQQVRVIE